MAYFDANRARFEREYDGEYVIISGLREYHGATPPLVELQAMIANPNGIFYLEGINTPWHRAQEFSAVFYDSQVQ